MSDKYGAKCPICHTEWTKTPRIVCNEFWYHCEKCEKKADELMKEAAEKKPDKYSRSSNVDWGYKDMYLGVDSGVSSTKRGGRITATEIKEREQLSMDELLEQAADDWDDAF